MSDSNPQTTAPIRSGWRFWLIVAALLPVAAWLWLMDQTAIALRLLSARLAIAIGMRVRPWLDDEFAHAAMLRVIRWGWGRRGD